MAPQVALTLAGAHNENVIAAAAEVGARVIEISRRWMDSSNLPTQELNTFPPGVPAHTYRPTN